MSAQKSRPRNPAALPAADVARLLSLASRREVSEEMVRRDLEAGAPANPDGTINLVHYTAWLVRQLAEDTARGDRPPQAEAR